MVTWSRCHPAGLALSSFVPQSRKGRGFYFCHAAGRDTPFPNTPLHPPSTPHPRRRITPRTTNPGHTFRSSSCPGPHLASPHLSNPFLLPLHVSLFTLRLTGLLTGQLRVCDRPETLVHMVHSLVFNDCGVKAWALNKLIDWATVELTVM